MSDQGSQKKNLERQRPLGGDPLSGYSLLEHPADLFVEVRAPTLTALFVNAALAMFDLLVETDGEGQGRVEEISLSDDDLEGLLVCWLGELLYRFERDRAVPAAIALEIDRNGCAVRTEIDWIPLTTLRHRFKSEIKAVTYHRIKIEETIDGWKANVLFDV